VLDGGNGMPAKPAPARPVRLVVAAIELINFLRE